RWRAGRGPGRGASRVRRTSSGAGSGISGVSRCSAIGHGLHSDEAGDEADHALHLGRVLVLDSLTDPPQAERPQGSAVAPLGPDARPDLRDAQAAHSSTAAVAPTASVARAPEPVATPRTSGTLLSRRAATSSGRRSSLRPATVAATRFTGLEVPSDLVRMSRMPASSSTARTPPPAITPVPSEAGFMRTLPAPARPVTWWVMVVRYLGTRKRFFLASSTAFWIARGTSLALPWPTPTVSTSDRKSVV